MYGSGFLVDLNLFRLMILLFDELGVSRLIKMFNLPSGFLNSSSSSSRDRRPGC